MDNAASKIQDMRQDAMAAIDSVVFSGSEKQAAWARQIARTTVYQLGDRAAANPRCEMSDAIYYAAIVAVAATITSAKWWIDNRDIDHNSALIPLLRACQERGMQF